MKNNGADNKTRGFLLVEMLMYIVGLAIVLSAITYATLNLYTYYHTLVMPARADRVGTTLVQTLGKELRSGVSVDFAESAFDTPVGFITIAARAGTQSHERYYGLEDGRIVFREDGGDDVYLTPEHLTISQFQLSSLASDVSEAIRYTIAVVYTVDGTEYTRTYTGFTVLRHSYE